jgi:hypothetical protein
MAGDRMWTGGPLSAGRAAELMAAMGRLRASQLRELAPRPFGLVNDELRLPVSVGAYVVEGRAGPSALLTMTLCYGIREDPLSPYIEVSTDFAPGHNPVALRYELGRAAGRLDPELAGGRPGRGDQGHRPPKGPLGRDRVEIVVAGVPRTAHTQIYRDLHGLQFRASGLPVTVITRGHWPDRPQFALITDLEPYLAATESPDSPVMKARFGRFPDAPPSH